MSWFRHTMRSFLWVYCVSFSTLPVKATASSALSKIRSAKRVVCSPNSRNGPGKFMPHHGLQLTTGTALQASPSSSSLVSSSVALLLRGGEVSEIASTAYDWCTNLGGPSALVAGAVIATMYENMGSGALEIEDKDSKAIKFGKRLTRSLLLSAFALEVISIFVTTVTGTMLLSKTEDMLDEMVEVTKDTTALSFLHDNFEFEYLTAGITFLQGLLNWLIAIALSHIIPSGEESKQTRAMNKFIGSALVLTVSIMLAFYNTHINFYSNYGQMLLRWFRVTFERFVWQWPPRPSVMLSVPCFAYTTYMGYMAFFGTNETTGASNVYQKEDKDLVTSSPKIS